MAMKATAKTAWVGIRCKFRLIMTLVSSIATRFLALKKLADPFLRNRPLVHYLSVNVQVRSDCIKCKNGKNYKNVIIR